MTLLKLLITFIRTCVNYAKSQHLKSLLWRISITHGFNRARLKLTYRAWVTIYTLKPSGPRHLVFLYYVRESILILFTTAVTAVTVYYFDIVGTLLTAADNDWKRYWLSNTPYTFTAGLVYVNTMLHLVSPQQGAGTSLILTLEALYPCFTDHSFLEPVARCYYPFKPRLVLLTYQDICNLLPLLEQTCYNIQYNPVKILDPCTVGNVLFYNFTDYLCDTFVEIGRQTFSTLSFTCKLILYLLS